MSVATSPPAPRRRRGLFDSLLLLCLGYAVYAATPVGAVVETGIRVARGQKDHPSWFATFRGRDTAAPPSSVANNTALADMARGDIPVSLQQAADTHGVNRDALAAIVAVRGACTADACSADAPDKLAMYAPGSAGRVDVDVIARALKAARVALATDNDELAIEALFLGTPAVTLAVEQARRSSLEGADDVEVHGSFLAPGARRGPLQGALAVLLVHRLRTLAWPADSRFRITSPFGERVHPVTGKTTFHNGTDVGVPSGTPLMSAHNGQVKRQSVDSISGNYVIVDHGLGIQTTYCHLTQATVHERERIRRLAVIGNSGATGRVTGPHLHYVLRLSDKAVDPERYGQAPGNSGALVAPPPPPPPPPPPVLPVKGAKPPKVPKVPPGAPVVPPETAVVPPESPVVPPATPAADPPASPPSPAPAPSVVPAAPAPADAATPAVRVDSAP
jgi:murein DD-endopeptidase